MVTGVVKEQGANREAEDTKLREPTITRRPTNGDRHEMHLMARLTDTQ